MMQIRHLILAFLLMALSNTALSSGKVDGWIYGSLPAQTLAPDTQIAVAAENVYYINGFNISNFRTGGARPDEPE